MNIRLVEPVTPDIIENNLGQKLYHVKPIAADSAKYREFMQILQTEPCPSFLALGQWLLNFLKNSGFPSKAKDTIENPLYLMTDFSDPRPLKGLRVEGSNGIRDYPELCFLGFYTDWADLEESGIAEIFGHEYAHLWFSLLNFDVAKMQSNKFHTSTAVTDAFTAFYEGFAEHLQIVADDLAGKQEPPGELWDYGLDAKAWICARDQQLRSHAVKNNRFVYQTAIPGEEEFDSYINLHMAHITSSAFTPERLKNGSQVMASEGAVASVFYHIYISPIFKNQYCHDGFYRLFGAAREEVNAVQNLYLKILYALAQTDLESPRLFVDFVRTYGECFPAEREAMIKLFLELTHFVTVSHKAAGVFGNLYRIGRRGIVEDFKRAYVEAKALKKDLLAQVLAGEISLDAAVYPEVWVEGDYLIPPVPWEPEQLTRYCFDLNAASEVDLMSLKGTDLEQAKAVVSCREKRQGFKSPADFQGAFPDFIP